MEDTIAAVSTAPGEGGIGIVRISGPQALSILGDVFTLKNGNRPDSFKDRYMTYGDIRDGSLIIDEAMVVYMKGPRSYTGEDVVEIQCHGSMISIRSILKLVLSKGAIMAEPGEFTKRAFLNGRLDLSQAEAVIDVINAKSDTSAESAVKQLNGSVSMAISDIRHDMADLLSHIIAHIEYPEEDLEDLLYSDVISRIDGLSQEVEALRSTFRQGRLIRDGLKISIVGRPNAGKSSLMNRLLRADRAIVTDIPGTTRDTIEEYALIGDIPVIITDTAGIRTTDDAIERIGIEKSRRSMEDSDLVFVMIDGSAGLLKEDSDLLQESQGQRRLVILNKSDLGCLVSEAVVRAAGNLSDDDKIIVISAASGEGISLIEEALADFVYGGSIRTENAVVITNSRHEELMRRALSYMNDARNMLEMGEALDFAETDLRSAWTALGEINGEAVSEDIISEVFSRFCLGK